jgi:flagellar basal body-associated protein FliL
MKRVFLLNAAFGMSVLAFIIVVIIIIIIIITTTTIIYLFIYLCSSNPEGDHSPQDIEHIKIPSNSINTHYSML